MPISWKRPNGWPVPARILVLLAIPLAVAGWGGTEMIRHAAEQRSAAQADAALVSRTQAVVDVLTAVQRERAASADAAPEARAATDAAITAAGLDQIRLDQLADIRDIVVPATAIARYTAVTGSLLDLLDTYPARLSSASLAEALRETTALRRAREYLDQNRLLLLSATPLNESATTQARSALSLGLRPGVLDEEQNRTWTRLATTMLPPSGGFRPVVPRAQWEAATGPALTGLDQRIAQRSTETADRAGKAAESAGAALLTTVLVLLVAGVLGAVGVVVLLRQITRRLTAVNNAAAELANRRLPELLRDIRDGRIEGQQAPSVVPTLPQEFAAVTDAFGVVCAQAVAAVGEQREMRSGYAEVFTNMFRRGQSLVQRQLHLIERLEADEESPSQLAKLFQLDHLVTRMRRNNENILVLSGTEVVRKATQPTSVESLLQAAKSEVEAYWRVEVIDPPKAHIAGAAASDLARTLAELIDNAISFSPPETTVSVQAQVLRDGSLSIAVIDEGIGMTDDEVRAANGRLTRLGSTELVRSRRVGLVVVGRLAGRHGFGVELLGGDQAVGTIALVSVPADLVEGGERPGWADRRLALQAAASRRRKAETPDVQHPGPAPDRSRQAPPPDVPPSGPSADRSRQAPPPDVQPAGTAPERSRQLVEQSHTDIPDDLPTRTPNRLIGKNADPAKRAASGWFKARDTAGQPRSVSVAGEAAAAPDGWSVLSELSGPRHYDYTDDGLPIRQRGAQLVPGSARRDGGPREIIRDPARTRSRLSGFQRGVRKAKDPDQSRVSRWAALGKSRKTSANTIESE